MLNVQTQTLTSFLIFSTAWIFVKGTFTQANEQLWKVEQAVMDMVKTDNSMLNLQAESLAHCASTCTSINSCRSFFFSAITKSCIGHDRVPGVEEMTQLEGYRMFYGSQRPGYCTNDFSYVPRVDMCYKIYSGLGSTKTAKDARVFCEGLSGHLIRIDSLQRLDIILKDANFDMLPIPYFIDGFLGNGTDWFLYSNNRNVSLPFDQGLWASYEPSKDSGEDMCIALYPDGVNTEWADYRCDDTSYQYRYICELSET